MAKKIFKAMLVIASVAGAMLLIDHWGALGFFVSGAAASTILLKDNNVKEG